MINWDDKSDVELVRLFRSGDDFAFDAIVLRFQDRIFRLARVWLYDEQSAADVAQEVFVRSYKGLRSFRFRSTPFTWLYRTTRNVCRENNRRRRAEALDYEPADSAAGPERQATDEQGARRIRELVAALPARQQEVVMLRIFEDLSVRETAQAMGCREGTVKALLHKAVSQLKLKIKQTGIEHG
ncbi:MAG: RNA polymerase sigma factor [Gammaproteobacteria bacterium]